MKLARKLKLWIVIDYHDPPGARDENNGIVMYTNKTLHDLWLKQWKQIATRFKDEPMVWGYDLINEPGTPQNNIYHHIQSQYDCAKMIREIDPNTPIIVELYPWNTVHPYIDYAFPLKDIIYSIHIYEPITYTHQGVNSYKNNTGSYPGTFISTSYNKEQLEKTYAPVLEFQKAHNAHIYLGEFSAIIWAGGNDKYIEDVIKIAEENNWDWTYHAFREWPGWSVEHEYLNGPRVATTPRKEVLLKYYKLNKDATEAVNESKSNGGMIAGIVIVIIIIIIVVIVFLIIRKRKNVHEESSKSN